MSHSTPEAELVACAEALRRTGLPALDVWDVLRKAPMPMRFMEDNTATIQVVKHGHSKALRHLNRTHDVSLRWVKEVFDKSEQLTLAYIKSAFANLSKILIY